MPSRASTHTLGALLADAAALQDAHTKLKIGKRDCRRELSVYQENEVDQKIEENAQNMRNELNAALINQHLRDHPEDSPAAIAARISSHPDIVAKAKDEWVVEWNKDHPFSTSFDRPPVPESYLDKAVRQAEAQKQPDLDSRIAFLEARIAQLEHQKPSVRGELQKPGDSKLSFAVQKTAAPTPLAKTNSGSILTRALPDGRIMAIIGGETRYYKNAEEAKAAIDKIQRDLKNPPPPAK